MHRFKSAPLALATLCLCLSPSVPAVAMPERAIASGTPAMIGRAATLIHTGSPMLAQSTATQDRQAEADRLNDLGIQQYQTSQFTAALQSWQQALTIYRKIKDRRGEGNALNGLGNAHYNLRNYLKAIDYHKQYLAITLELKDRWGEGRVWGNLGIVYHDLREYLKAIECQKKYLVIAREIKNRKGEVNALGSLAIAYSALENYVKVIEYLEQRLAIAREIGDRQGEGRSLGGLVVAYNEIGNYAKAIEYNEQSLAIAREFKDRQWEGLTLASLGNSYYWLGNYARAIEYHEQHLSIARELKDQKKEAAALGDLGNAYNSLGNHAKAIEYHEQSLVINRKLKERLRAGPTLGNLGNVYFDLGNYPKAREYYEQYLTIAREAKNRLWEGTALGNLGLVYNELGNSSKAKKYLEQHLAIAQEIKDRNGEGRALGNLGLIYYGLWNNARAIEYYGRHAAIAREIKNRDGEKRALSNIADSLKEENQTDLAITFYKQSVNVTESIRTDLRKLPREAQEIYTSKLSNTYRNLADLLLTQGRTREAQVILELLKVQEAQIYNEQKTLSIQIPLHPIETQIWKQVEQQKTFTLATLSPLGKTLKQNRDRITQDMNAMPIAIGNPQTILKANPNALYIQNLVVLGDNLTNLFRGAKFWVIWTNAKGEVKTVSLNVRQQQLAATVDRLRKDLGNPYSNLNDLKATSQQLYNWLIPPALQTELAQSPNTQLLFSLDHVTRYIPIAALHDGKQYLIQKHTLSNLITTDSDMGDRLALNGQTPNILALGTSKALAGFSALPNVEAELQAIVRNKSNPRGIYPGTLRLNEAFTADSLRTSEPHRILHIATHGSFNPKSITASFLLLGNGNHLPITDIAALTNLNTTHLVVLSACETGLSSSTSDGTEISGISGYFLRRGARSVIASLWNVNDASTSLLMQQFYKKLANGMTKAEALKTVQQDFIQGKLTAKDAPMRGASLTPVLPPELQRTRNAPANFSHPYYWAPFILIGNSL
jgi:CHAT domain-containing protein